MPSVKIPKKSTDVDMTPFVDMAFLILSFFMMATKFKPPEPVEVTHLIRFQHQLPENNAILITIDKERKVYFTVLSEKDPICLHQIIKTINQPGSLGLTPAEMANYSKTYLSVFALST